MVSGSADLAADDQGKDRGQIRLGEMLPDECFDLLPFAVDCIDQLFSW